MDSPGFIAVARRLFPNMDVRVYRLTGGRVALGGGGGKVLLLTTTGRRSGLPRVTPLIYAEEAGGYLVVGSNWGERHDPAWVANLRADARGSVEIGRRRMAVAARVLVDEEREKVWRLLVDGWPIYADLAARAGERQLPVVHLVPV
jgi:deazaflavin-dependent oxidoreductase (nitroreductase family)